MKRRALPGVLLFLLVGVTARGEVTVRVEGGRVDVSAQAEPLSAVLDAFAAETGTAVTFDGPPPRQPVTLDIEGRTPARALTELLEGLGVSYVLRSTADGAGVEALHIVDGTAAGKVAASTAPAPAPAEPESWAEPDQEAEPELWVEEPMSELEAELEGDDGPGAYGPAAGPRGFPAGMEPPADMEIPPGVEPPGAVSASIGEPAPIPGLPTEATSGAWPAGMTPLDPTDSGEAPGSAAPRGLPPPPTANPSASGQVAPPPGMTLDGGVPSVPPPGAPN